MTLNNAGLGIYDWKPILSHQCMKSCMAMVSTGILANAHSGIQAHHKLWLFYFF